MATPLDLGLIQFFIPVFVWILVFVISYVVLQSTSVFGDNKAFLTAAALSLATISIFYAPLTTLIAFVTPWMAFIFIFLLLMFSAFMFLGIKQERIWDELSVWTVIIVTFLILLIGLTQAFSEIFSPYGPEGTTKTIKSEALRTMFHPRILGALFLIIVM